MSSVKFVIDTDGVQKNILQSESVLAECERVAKEQGEATYTQNGCHVLAFVGTQRVHAIAFPNTKDNPS